MPVVNCFLFLISKKPNFFLLIRNEKKLTTGIITDGQIRRFNEKKDNIFQLSVKNIMTKKPISIDKDALAIKALSLMSEKKITSLCVYNKKNKQKTIGVLHIHNLLSNLN